MEHVVAPAEFAGVVDGRHVLGLLDHADQAGVAARVGAAGVMRALKELGIERLIMISGDNRGAAEAMARRLGLRPEEGEVMADVLPGDKAARVAWRIP